MLIKDSPNFIGVNKGEDKLRAKVNEIIAKAKSRATRQAVARSGSAAAAGDLLKLQRRRAAPVMRYELHFGAVLRLVAACC